MEGLEYQNNSPFVFNRQNKTLSLSLSELKLFMIHSIPIMFNRIIEENKLLYTNTLSSKYDLHSNPSISLADYIYRLIKCTNAEVSTIIHSLILIDKLYTYKKFKITRKNIYKIFFITLFISIKLLEDSIFVKDEYIFASGLSEREIAILEYQFITDLDYNLIVKDNEFQVYLNKFVNAAAK